VPAQRPATSRIAASAIAAFAAGAALAAVAPGEAEAASPPAVSATPPVMRVVGGVAAPLVRVRVTRPRVSVRRARHVRTETWLEVCAAAACVREPLAARPPFALRIEPRHAGTALRLAVRIEARGAGGRYRGVTVHSAPLRVLSLADLARAAPAPWRRPVVRHVPAPAADAVRLQWIAFQYGGHAEVQALLTGAGGWAPRAVAIAGGRAGLRSSERARIARWMECGMRAAAGGAEADVRAALDALAARRRVGYVSARALLRDLGAERVADGVRRWSLGDRTLHPLPPGVAAAWASRWPRVRADLRRLPAAGCPV